MESSRLFRSGCRRRGSDSRALRNLPGYAVALAGAHSVEGPTGKGRRGKSRRGRAGGPTSPRARPVCPTTPRPVFPSPSKIWTSALPIKRKAIPQRLRAPLRCRSSRKHSKSCRTRPHRCDHRRKKQRRTRNSADAASPARAVASGPDFRRRPVLLQGTTSDGRSEQDVHIRSELSGGSKWFILDRQFLGEPGVTLCRLESAAR